MISAKNGRKFSDGIPTQPATFSSMRISPISSVYGVNYDRLSLVFQQSVFSLAVRTASKVHIRAQSYTLPSRYL